MRVRVPTTKLIEAGQPSWLTWMEVGVTEARHQQGGSLGCVVCNQTIRGEGFVIACLPGHGNKFYHARCLTDGELDSAPWPKDGSREAAEEARHRGGQRQGSGEGEADGQ